MEYNELYHHGINGMKWGVRRFQNPDGSLKPAGEQRYGSGKSLGQRIKEHKVAKTRKKNLQKARDAREAKKKAEAERLKTAEERAKLIKAGKIKIKDMTDEEIANRTARLENEKRLKQLERDTEVITAGKAFVNTVSKQVLKPALIDSGKNTLTKFLNMKGDDFIKELRDAAGLKDPGKQSDKRVEKLRQEFAELELKKKIADIKNPKSTADEIRELEDAIKLIKLKDEDYQSTMIEKERVTAKEKIKKAQDYLDRNNGEGNKDEEKDD